MQWTTPRVLFAAGLVAVALCDTIELFGQRQSVPATRSGQQDTLLVISVPTGLKVYLVPDNEATTDKKEDDSVPLVEKHSIIDERNFKGVTPLALRLAAGKYLVAIAPVTLLDEHYQTGQIDPGLRPRVMVSFENPGDPQSFQGGLTGAVVYQAEKLSGLSQKLFLLALPRDATLDVLESSYPAERNFSFDESVVSQKLIEAKVPDGDLPRVLSLLHRGGKLALVRGDIRWVVVVSDDGTPTIKTQIRGR
ncbi:MAG: hypothetical protein WCI74_18485 [Actinomycetes bacterium]